MRLLTTIPVVIAAVLALLVALRGRVLLGGQQLGPGATRVVGLGLVALMLAVTG